MVDCDAKTVFPENSAKMVIFGAVLKERDITAVNTLLQHFIYS